MKVNHLLFLRGLGPHCHVLGNPGRELRRGTCRWGDGALVDGRRWIIPTALA